MKPIIVLLEKFKTRRNFFPRADAPFSRYVTEKNRKREEVEKKR
jgi:hypothetical protein